MAIIYGKNTAVDYAAGNLASFGKSYSRMGAAPLDMYEVWYDKDALINYASFRGNDASGNPVYSFKGYDEDGNPIYNTTDAVADTSAVTSYVGQKVAYVNDTEGKIYHYSIELDGSLKEIGSTPIGDDLSIEIIDGKIQVKGFGDHYYVTFTATNIYGGVDYADYTSYDFSDAENLGSISIYDAENGQYLRGANNTWAIFENDGMSDGSWRQATEEEVAAIREEGGEERVEGFIEGLEPRIRPNDEGGLEIAWYKPSETTVEGVNSALQTLTTKVNVISTEVDTIENTIGQREDILVDSDDPESKVDTIWANINNHESRIDTIENDYLKTTDKTELDNKITAVADRATALENKVDIGDDKTVSTYIAEKIADAQIGKLTKVIADSVDIEGNKVTIDGEATDPAENVIYMVKVEGASGDAYKEYMLINNVLVQTGDTTTDLSNYYTKTQVDNLIPDELGVMSVNEGNGIEITGTDADPVIAIKLAENQGNVILNTENGLKAEVDLSAYATKQFVGDIPEDADATTIIGYINEKAQEVLDSATGGSSESAASVKQQLDTYKAANDPKVNALLAEVYGALSEGQTEYDYNADSRIDALEKADAAQDILIANNTTLAQQGVDDAAVAKSTADQNKKDLTTLQSNFDTIVTNGETGLVAKVATLESANTQMGARVTALETKDTSIETSLGEHTNKISALESKDTELTALIQGNTDKFANYYTKTEAEAAVKAVTGDVATDTTLVAMISAKADKSTIYTKTEVDNLLANLDQTELENGIKENADAIAILNGEDTGKSARTIAVEEIAKVVNNAPEDFDTLKEIADYIASDKTGAAEINNKLAAHDAILAGIGGTDEPATVSALIDNKIAAIPAYDLPLAMANQRGGIKSAADYTGINPDDPNGDSILLTTPNAVYVDSATEVGVVKAVTTDILVNGTNELILFGGDAQPRVEE